MNRKGDEVHIHETEASAGSKEGVVRWVLGIGLVLAVVAMTFIWIGGSMTRDHATTDGDPATTEPATNVTVPADEGDGQ
ncbi:MAG: hypothetical protein IE933_07485 [Sphingomonadales bacterium]|nr:hypothetical protein [Sphingomonadales bacterium]MBD3773498.1 hypothetical protein [Paracoccaceae bacterium]